MYSVFGDGYLSFKAYKKVHSSVKWWDNKAQNQLCAAWSKIVKPDTVALDEKQFANKPRPGNDPVLSAVPNKPVKIGQWHTQIACVVERVGLAYLLATRLCNVVSGDKEVALAWRWLQKHVGKDVCVIADSLYFNKGVAPVLARQRGVLCALRRGGDPTLHDVITRPLKRAGDVVVARNAKNGALAVGYYDLEHKRKVVVTSMHEIVARNTPIAVTKVKALAARAYVLDDNESRSAVVRAVQPECDRSPSTSATPTPTTPNGAKVRRGWTRWTCPRTGLPLFINSGQRKIETALPPSTTKKKAQGGRNPDSAPPVRVRFDNDETEEILQNLVDRRSAPAAASSASTASSKPPTLTNSSSKRRKYNETDVSTPSHQVTDS